MATFKAIVFKGHLKQDGTSNIKIRIYHNRESQYIATCYFIQPEGMDGVGRILPNVANGEMIEYEINAYIQKIRREYLKLGQDRTQFMSCKDLKEQIEKSLAPDAEFIDFVEFAQNIVIQTKKKRTAEWYSSSIATLCWYTKRKKIEDVADKYGYNVLVASSNETFEKEKKNIDIFLANRCDGIILSISKATTSYEHIKQIQDMGVPLVLFDRTAKELDVSKVVADDADAAFKIVQHLIHGGARRIALLTGPEQLSIGKNRMKGYLKAMTLNKLEINTDYIVRCEDFSVKAAKEATQRLLNMKNMPDAIFGINDDMAIGAIEAIKEKGLKIPEEVAVFGFSNSKRSRYMTPSVSTINQFPEKIGETAAELLFEQILDAKHAQIREEVINSELIVRESSDRSFMQ